MARRLVLHIGAMKSGTTFVQNVLSANKDLLARRGVLWPGRQWLDQAAAVVDLIEHPDGTGFAPEGPWRRLVDEVNAWDGDAIVSMEFLGPRNGATIRQVLAAFDERGRTDVEVVLTARDLSRQLPAMWQESVQNGGVYSWPGYVAAVREFPGRRSKPGRSFWRQQSYDETTARWLEHVGRDRFTLVTVPPRGGPTGTLWERFCEAAALDPTGLELQGPRNTSIGTASAMVLRELNVRLVDDDPEAQGLPRADYDAIVKYDLAKTLLAARSEPTVGCDEPWLRERAARQLDELRRLGPRVVGDLDDLVPGVVPGMMYDELTDADRLEATGEALEHLVRQAVDQRQEVRRLRRRVRQLQRQQQDQQPDQQAPAGQEV